MSSTTPPSDLGAGSDVANWAAANRSQIRSVLADTGAVHIRDAGVVDATDVAAVTRRLTTGLMEDQEAFAEREPLPGDVYSSSSWPASQQMCMHHELSYRLEFPAFMTFACLQAADDGGEIGIADSTEVLDALPTELVDRFSTEGWLLTRNYTDEIGLSVADAFGTEDRRSIESYCRANAIEFEWQPDGGLRTEQRRSAVVHHPQTDQPCWFNQIAFLSEWTMKPEVHEFLVDMYGRDGLPFNTRFGNGDPIGDDVVATINEAYDANTMLVDPQPGDLLFVDNIRCAHSREPYEGSREVVVALADPVRLADVSPTVEVPAADS